MSKIEIVAYDPRWVELFKRESDILHTLFPDSITEHIGSTSVVGLDAKPIVDIMVGFETLNSEEITPVIESIGYEHWKEDTFQHERLFFTKWDSEKKERLMHIHATVIGSEFWKDQLAFRNILRTKPQVAEEYAILKKQLAEKFKEDRDGYTEAKTAFIRSVLGQY